jgi:hypothetical protein
MKKEEQKTDVQNLKLLVSLNPPLVLCMKNNFFHTSQIIHYCNVVSLLLFLVFTTSIVKAEKDSIAWSVPPEVSLSGFVDVFYAFDFNKPNNFNNTRHDFIYNHNRYNEFNINLGILKLSATHEKYRANLALQAGTYANDNYVAESNTLKNINEANVGISLNKKNNLWLDAGIFSSHLGFESAISTENWTLTRSLVAENSPYFLSGAKLTYQLNEKITVSGTVCNGWQRIRRVYGNSMLSYGTQVNIQLSEKTQFNWSTFIGTDDPDAFRKLMLYNNFYLISELNDKIGLIAGFDIGYRQRFKGSNAYDNWHISTLIIQYKINKLYAMSFRGEYFEDKMGVIVPTGHINGFQTIGGSINFDYQPTEKVMLRIEGRTFNSAGAIYKHHKSGNVNTNYFIVSSLAINF